MSNPTPEPEDPFVFARVKSTGESQSIPRGWLGHEVLGADFELAPDAGLTDATVKAPTIAEVLDRVGDDKAAAAAALETEQARETPRKSLVKDLQTVIDAPPTDPANPA